MSADNIIYVHKIDSKYWVWYDFASNDNPQPDMKSDISFWTKEAALEFAEELKGDYGYVEYGICSNMDELKKIKKEEQEQIRKILGGLENKQ